MTTAPSHDLCVVGAGIAGALIAERAARAGRNVILLEAGERYPFEKRMEFLRRRQTLGGPSWPWLDVGRDRYVDSTAKTLGIPYPLNRNRVKAVGGSTLHWGGRTVRLMPSDFRAATTYGLGLDWPLDYAELEPYYSAAEWMLGVAGTAHELAPPRSRDYPLPGFPLSADEQFWLPVAERRGVKLYSSPFAINSAPYDGRSACRAYACCQICPSGARYSADWHVISAEQSGRCTLMTRTVARRIEVSAAGAVQAIHATTLEGKELEIRASNYVIAAHAVESARLLLLSRCGNHSDQVGRNFMEHIYVSAGGFMPQRKFSPGRVGFERLESVSFYDGTERRERGAIKLEFGFERDPLVDMEDGGLWGEALRRREQEEFGHWLGIDAETEMQPKAGSRITLDTRETDLFGDPVPHINLEFDATDAATQARAGQLAAELLEACGAKRVRVDPLSSASFACHHLGTCRMSEDPTRGVVDRDCRVHGTNNLYVAGGSVFPTSGALQPTLTIAALSLRLADRLLRSS